MPGTSTTHRPHTYSYKRPPPTPNRSLFPSHSPLPPSRSRSASHLSARSRVAGAGTCMAIPTWGGPALWSPGQHPGAQQKFVAWYFSKVAAWGGGAEDQGCRRSAPARVGRGSRPWDRPGKDPGKGHWKGPGKGPDGKTLARNPGKETLARPSARRTPLTPKVLGTGWRTTPSAMYHYDHHGQYYSYEYC